MDFISGAIHGFKQDVAQGVHGVVNGAERALDGAGELAKGALSFNGGEALEGVKDLALGAMNGLGGAMSLTPEALAASTLMQGGEAAVSSLMPRIAS